MADISVRSPFALKNDSCLIGQSSAMNRLKASIARVAVTNTTLLLIGESGTGKELIARIIHAQSTRRNATLVAVNCGAIAADLIEAALFGHEKGSFTGAVRQQTGYFEHASGGSLFLDELTEMPIDMQVKLLRVLESGRFVRVGGDQEIQVDVRLIAATNQGLEQAVREANLRADLMYRLAGFPIQVPPLRDREGDIALLAEHFLSQLNRQYGTRKRFARNGHAALRAYPWPGNVRELKNVILRSYVLSGDLITMADFIPDHQAQRPIMREDGMDFAVGTPLAAAQSEFIRATLRHFAGNKRMAAQTLGISLKTLYNRLKTG